MEHKHGCIVLHHGKIISKGYNFNKVQYLQLATDQNLPNSHAVSSSKSLTTMKKLVGFSRIWSVHSSHRPGGSPSRSVCCSTHAEMSAIISLQGKKADTLLVVRVGKDGTLRDSKPCKYCYEFILRSGIKKIYYSTNDQEIVYTKTCMLNYQELTLSRSNRIHLGEITTLRDRCSETQIEHLLYSPRIDA